MGLPPPYPREVVLSVPQIFGTPYMRAEVRETVTEFCELDESKIFTGPTVPVSWLKFL